MSEMARRRADSHNSDSTPMSENVQSSRIQEYGLLLREAHVVDLSALVTRLNSDFENGLDERSVAIAQQRFGVNELAESPPTPVWRRFLGQFKELVIWILIVAAIVSGVVGEIADSVAILAIVLLNGIIGFLQEERAEQALTSLRKMSAPLAKVVRGGKTQSVPAAQLVPGDRIELESGDYVPADARLISSYGLKAQEASLTGESTPVDKNASETLPERTPLADRINMVYLGTIVAAGRGSAIVVATGMQTELGRIAGLLARQAPEPTPLQRRLAELGRTLVTVCLVLVAIIFALQMARGGNLLEVFMVSVSLAVAAVPEGLPAVVTLTLALGLQRMVARNALIRKLPSVETLGSVTVICSDKTGTLTRNEMTVRSVVVGDDEFRVTGTGYQPRGRFERVSDRSQITDVHELPADLLLLLKIATHCNNAELVPAKGGNDDWQVLGDPTEGALLAMVMKGGIDITCEPCHVIEELPFDSERKAMSVVMKGPDGGVHIYTKGAPEAVLEMCSFARVAGDDIPLTTERRKEILDRNTAMAARALRVLALAYRHLPDAAAPATEENLVFVGLVGMIDPPRPEAKEAVGLCQTAGIRPIMITGDHPATSRAIGEELGLLAGGGGVLTGLDLESMPENELAKDVAKVSIYARVSAEHKLRIVEAWRKRGDVVAMTGDGVNDAPAVKAADIGIAMGITGTDVTKEASDMVLMDDNFRSIVSAIEEGRSIFDNIQNVVHYLLATNAGEVLLMFFASLVGWPAPLAAIQILWMNLVTDGLPALALAMEPPDRNVMCRPPREPGQRVLTPRRGALILTQGALIASAAAVAFWWAYQGDAAAFDHARMFAFCTLVFAQLFFSFACRSEHYTLLELGFFTNPHLLGAIAISGLLQLSVVLIPVARPIFEVASHPGRDWPIVLLLALFPVTVFELAKLFYSFGQRLRRRMAERSTLAPG